MTKDQHTNTSLPNFRTPGIKQRSWKTPERKKKKALYKELRVGTMAGLLKSSLEARRWRRRWLQVSEGECFPPRTAPGPGNDTPVNWAWGQKKGIFRPVRGRNAGHPHMLSQEALKDCPTATREKTTKEVAVGSGRQRTTVKSRGAGWGAPDQSSAAALRVQRGETGTPAWGRELRGIFQKWVEPVITA